ncbi:MAG: hypothetical protein LBU05_01510 [Bifidobacteriaceae bacterium]|jgi:hypothetical protein|nr:hypothetical protein [Bifidobacteriaceae bacterium]
MPTSTFFVAGDPAKAGATVSGLLSQRGFSLRFDNPHNAVAERGSKGATIALGALAGPASQHLRIRISFAIDPQGNAAITLASDTTGMAAGLIGANRAKKAYAELFAAVRAAFWQAGVLLGEASA